MGWLTSSGRYDGPDGGIVMSPEEKAARKAAEGKKRAKTLVRLRAIEVLAEIDPPQEATDPAILAEIEWEKWEFPIRARAQAVRVAIYNCYGENAKHPLREKWEKQPPMWRSSRPRIVLTEEDDKFILSLCRS